MARRNSTVSTNTSDDSIQISSGQGVSQEIEITNYSTSSTVSESIQENASQSVSNDVSRSEVESSTASSVNPFDIDMGNSVTTNTSSSRTSTSKAGVGHDHETYTHDQGMPSTVWNVVHNLERSPSVTIVDTTGEIVDGKVVFIDTNEINIEFNAAFSGQAYLN